MRKLAEKIAQNELVIYCQICGAVFYAGTIKHFIKNYREKQPRDFHVLAMRHVWNNPTHHITYDAPYDKLTSIIFMQYIPSLNKLVEEIKSRSQASLSTKTLFEDFWTGKTPVRCTSCNNLYFGRQGWLKAARCCLETKPYASELP